MSTPLILGRATLLNGFSVLYSISVQRLSREDRDTGIRMRNDNSLALT